MNVSNHHLAGRVVIVTGAGSGIRYPGSAVLPRLPSPRPERTFSASGAARPTCTKPPVHIPRSRRSLPTFAPTARPRPSSTRRLPVGKSRCAGDHCRGHRDNRARVSVRQCFYSVPARYAGRRLPVRLAARTVEIYDGPRLVARHDRAVGRYVEVLARLLPAAETPL
jgi:hypothetical protein